MTTTSEPLVFGPADRRSVEQLRNCQQVSGEPAEGVLCADHHLGDSMPIGGVMALHEKIMPAGVGFDIACGNCAVRTGMPASALDAGAAMDEIARTLSFGVGRKNREPVDHPVLDEIAAAEFDRQRHMARLAADQLGTIGGGNHYGRAVADLATQQGERVRNMLAWRGGALRLVDAGSAVETT